MASNVFTICKTSTTTSNTTLNAHVDRCLSKLSKSMLSETMYSKIKVKPTRKRSMVDIYAMAAYCTVEDLDRRNGTQQAKNLNSVDDGRKDPVEVKRQKVSISPSDVMVVGDGNECRLENCGINHQWLSNSTYANPLMSKKTSVIKQSHAKFMKIKASATRNYGVIIHHDEEQPNVRLSSRGQLSSEPATRRKSLSPSLVSGNTNEEKSGSSKIKVADVLSRSMPAKSSRKNLHPNLFKNISSENYHTIKVSKLSGFHAYLTSSEEESSVGIRAKTDKPLRVHPRAREFGSSSVEYKKHSYFKNEVATKPPACKTENRNLKNKEHSEAEIEKQSFDRISYDKSVMKSVSITIPKCYPKDQSVSPASTTSTISQVSPSDLDLNDTFEEHSEMHTGQTTSHVTLSSSEINSETKVACTQIRKQDVKQNEGHEIVLPSNDMKKNSAFITDRRMPCSFLTFSRLRNEDMKISSLQSSPVKPSPQEQTQPILRLMGKNIVVNKEASPTDQPNITPI